MNWSHYLNKRQLEAVEYVDGPVRVIAGAGSGKTRMLTYRIAYLVEELGTPSSRILAITFTNKAANEMKERIKRLSPNQYFPFISTYHSFCVRFLREEIEVLNFPINFSIMDEDDQKQILKESYEKYGIKKDELKSKTILKYIAEQKFSGTTPQNAMRKAEQLADQEYILLAKFYRDYVKTQEQSFALDFDDLLIKTNDVLSRYENIREKWSRRFNYVLVDEFQDTSPVQYSIVKHLSKDKQNLCVVGDPDQTIYTWRGADIKLIMNLEMDYPNLQTIVLDRNYRSSQYILNTANSLIMHNKNRIPKELYTKNDFGEKVEHYQAQSSDDEASWVSNKVRMLIKQGIKPNDIAILYRSNYLSRQIEQSLMMRGIQYRIYGAFKFFERKEIKDIICFMRVLNNKDPLALERIINVPARSVGAVTWNKIKQYSYDNNIKLYDALAHVSDLNKVSSKAKNEIALLFTSLEIYRNKTNTMPLVELLTAFLDDIKYFKYLDEDMDQDRKENVKELFGYIDAFEKNEQEGTIDKFLQQIAIYSAQDEIEAGDYISLMTIHISKGLEFDHVFIIGLNEDVFPSSHSLNEGRIEEERRTAYVAMTRARKKLFLTEASGFSFVTQSYRETSRFLHEIDKENVMTVSKQFGTVGKRYLEEDWFDSEDFSPKKANIVNYNDDEENNFHIDDIIIHERFGVGAVVSVYGDMIDVIFPHPHKRKTLKWNHKSIIRKLD